MRKQMTAVLAVAALAPLAMATPALAAPGNGAQRYSDTECFQEEPPGLPPAEVCITVKGRIKLTETPSGNFIVNDKGTYTSTFTSGDFTVTDEGSFKFNGVFKGEQVQVAHARGSVSTTFPNGVTCSGTFRFMVVKGEVKKEFDNYTCDGPVPEP